MVRRVLHLLSVNEILEVSGMFEHTNSKRGPPLANKETVQSSSNYSGLFSYSSEISTTVSNCRFTRRLGVRYFKYRTPRQPKAAEERNERRTGVQSLLVYVST